MVKTAYINTRVEKKLKTDAQKVLRNVGVNTSDAVSMFLRQVVLRRGIPFEVRVPNKETLKAIRELRDPKKLATASRYSSTEEMFKDILGKNWRHKNKKM